MRKKKIRYLLHVVARAPIITLSQRLKIQMYLDPQVDLLRLWKSTERLMKGVWAHLQGDRCVNLYSNLAKAAFSICNQGLVLFLTHRWSILRWFYKLYLFHLVTYTFGSSISKGKARSQLSSWTSNYFLSTICGFFCNANTVSGTTLSSEPVSNFKLISVPLLSGWQAICLVLALHSVPWITLQI